MPHTCFVNGCTKRSDDQVVKRSFYTVPAIINHQGEKTSEMSTKRREAWIAAINRQKPVSKYSKICSVHFVTGKPADLYQPNHPDWVPSLLMSGEKCRNHTVVEEQLCSSAKNINTMVRRCIVGGCSKTTADGVSLHVFPSDYAAQKQWITAIKTTRKNWTGQNVRNRSDSQLVCSAHFTKESFELSCRLKREMGQSCLMVLKKEAVPSIFLRDLPKTAKTGESGSGLGSEDESTQSKRHMGAFEKREREGDLARAQEENLVLTKKVDDLQKLVFGHKKWSVDQIKDSDEKTRIYTGLLSWSAFLNLYSITEHDITEVKCKPDSDGMEEIESMALTLSDELFAVLTTLKLGLFREDVADCFAIPVSTFDQIFRIWIACLFSKLPEWSSINLPSLKPPGLVVPSIVQNTANLKFILCWLKLTLGLDKKITESGNNERSFKILIALNCQGNIIFSSGIWVQKAAGLMVATNSGILCLIEDGDSIIVPSDIYIGSTVCLRNVETIMLPYDKVEKIGTADEQTQSVYNFIQQCTDRLKVFGIMNRIVPPELLGLCHKIVAVCSQLSNIYHS